MSCLVLFWFHFGFNLFGFFYLLCLYIYIFSFKIYTSQAQVSPPRKLKHTKPNRQNETKQTKQNKPNAAAKVIYKKSHNGSAKETSSRKKKKSSFTVEVRMSIQTPNNIGSAATFYKKFFLEMYPYVVIRSCYSRSEHENLMTKRILYKKFLFF
jgi:hypothetical protein